MMVSLAEGMEQKNRKKCVVRLPWNVVFPADGKPSRFWTPGGHRMAIAPCVRPINFAAVSPCAQRPRECTTNERSAILRFGFAMGNQHPLYRPGKNGFQRRARRAPMNEAGTPLSQRARLRCHDAVKAGQ
jgi:hypothetical protein